MISKLENAVSFLSNLDSCIFINRSWRWLCLISNAYLVGILLILLILQFFQLKRLGAYAKPEFI